MTQKLFVRRMIKSVLPALVWILSISGYGRAPSTPVAREIHFGSGNETLYGRMLLPDTAQKYPLVVFLSGSGPSSSYRTNYAGFLRYNFEEVLLSQGIGLLYFDKRGVGKSTGKWYRTDFYTRAKDAVAAIDFAVQSGFADPDRICIAGHSQGGWIAQIVAARYPDKIRCMVSMSGAAFGVFRQLVNDYQSELVCNGADSTRAHRKAIRKARFTTVAVTLFPVTANMKQLRLIRKFDPAGEIRIISRPALFTFAGNDELVYPAWSIGSLHQIFPGEIPGNFTLKTFDGTDHGYRIAPFCSRGTGTSGPRSAEFRDFVTGWIFSQLKNEIETNTNKSTVP